MSDGNEMNSLNARLIDNEKLKRNAQLRSDVLKLIRDFFHARSFMEVDTPLLDVCPSMEPAIKSFITDYFDGEKNHKMYLQSSPEYNMKKLLVSGYENIFQVTKSFRNSELTKLHNPEFTILEWYRAGCDYNKIMSDVEEMIEFLLSGLGRGNSLKYLNKTVDFSKPYDKLHVKEAFKSYAGLDIDAVGAEDYHEILTRKGLKIEQGAVDFNTFFYFIFVNEIEPHLGEGRPVFLVDFPVALGSLARRRPDDARYVERFELYIKGLELCNAFSELNDHEEQEERFVAEKRKRVEAGLDDYPLDRDFLEFLKRGMPESAGIAFGLDRLLMLLADTNDISDVMLFPFSKIGGFCPNI